MSTSTTTATTEAPMTAQQELRETALLISECAEASGQTISELCPGLAGGEKTLTKIRRNDWAGLNPETLLESYRAARVTLAAEGGEDDALFEDLSTARAVRAQFSRLKLSTTAAKLVLVEGFTGSGKSSAGRIIARKYNELSPTQQVFQIEASAGWGDRPNALMAAMLKALGRPDSSRNQAARLDKVCEVLSERPVVFIIDEVHDFGVRCLRTIKTLLNQSKVKIVMLCHPRLFKDLERENWDDLSQLTGNRMIARIELGSIQEADVLLLLERRLAKPGLAFNIVKACAKEISTAALNNGNLAFVREVIVRLNRLTKKQPGTPLTQEDVAATVKAELRARKRAGSSL